MNPHLPSKLVAVVVPIYKREITLDEMTSLKHLRRYLGKYDKYLVCPEGLNLDYDYFSIQQFDKKYFNSIQAYNNLLVSKHFYRAFEDYQYILMYQLDCLVFSDQLLDWCAKGYDYIGAPWLKTLELPWLSEETVGNGGFSLRKVSSFLKVLDIYYNLKNRIKRNFFMMSTLKINNRLRKAVDRITHHMNTPDEIFHQAQQIISANRASFHAGHYNEDLFWSREAQKWWPDFSIAPVEEALSFAFEINPRLCFERNHNQLPFGCHAWSKYDKSFWEPYLI